MKIIDLLNMIANGEEVPEKIKYDTKEMKYNHNKQDYLGYYSNGNGEWLFQYLFDRCRNTQHFINDKVEIIEEEKEIEKLDENNTNVLTNIIENRKKINEIIDAVNEIRKEK